MNFSANWSRFFVLIRTHQLGGSVTESGLNLGMILRKRVAVVGSTLRARSLEYKRRLTEEVWDRDVAEYFYMFCTFFLYCRL